VARGAEDLHLTASTVRCGAHTKKPPQTGGGFSVNFGDKDA
jgi:hypothetical protein